MVIMILLDLKHLIVNVKMAIMMMEKLNVKNVATNVKHVTHMITA